MTNPRGGTTLQMGSPGDQIYVHQHSQAGVKSGQYLPPVRRDLIVSNMDQMRFMERIQDEDKCKNLWQSKQGKYLYVKGGPEGHFSEFGQRRFNLSGQIKREFVGSKPSTFFESMEARQNRDGKFQFENSKACYERQTGLHFRNPMPSEHAGRLKATDHSGYSTPVFSARGVAARRARSSSPLARSQPFYLDHDRFRESWPYSPEVTWKGQQVWWRRHHTDRLNNSDYPSWEVPRDGRPGGDPGNGWFTTRGTVVAGQPGLPPGF